MQAWQWLLLVLAVAILAPVVTHLLAALDTRRQLRGDIPERKADATLNPHTPHPGDGRRVDGEILAGQARMKSGQNVMGMR